MRNKHCLVCQSVFARHAKFSNEQWARAKYCSLHCRDIGRRRPIKERLFRNREIDSTGCWLWIGSRNRYGYGQMPINGVTKTVHRLSWTTFRGNIPSGQLVLHRCDIRNCFNPRHLYLGSVQDNVDDMFARGRPNHHRGEQCRNTVLTNDLVLEIHGLDRSKWGVFSAFAREHGLDRSTVTAAARGDTWAHRKKWKGP